MNSETVCEICSHMISSPTVLMCCFSSVCSDCLKKITVKDPKRVTRPSYKCPFCSKEQQISTSAKPNVFLSRYIEFCYRKGKLQNVPCSQCQTSIKSTDANICGACGNQYFCKDCNSTVHNTETAKSHIRTSVNTVLKNYNGSLNKAMICPLHMKEKIEFICLKDLVTFCKTCVANHKRTCKEHKIVSLEKAHIELASLLSKKIAEVNGCRNTADGEYTNIKQKLEEFNLGLDEKISTIEKYFNELREILNAKEKEIKATVEQIFNNRKISLNREVHSLENVNFRIESLIDIVEFAMSYPSTFFCEGANYLLQRLNRLGDSDPHVKTVRPSNLPDLELYNIEYCKTALGRISIEEVLPGFNNQRRSSNIILNEDMMPREDLESSPTSPNTENYSIFHETKKRTHIKTQSIVAQYQGKYPSSPSKPASNPETKTSSPQREITPISMRPDSYKNLVAKLKTREQMEKTISGNESLQRLRIIKDHNSTSAASLSDSHRGCSRTPISKCASMKYWGESPKFKTCNSQDFLWSLALSPTIKEANPFSEQDHQMILEVQKNPLAKRKFVKIAQTANSIFVAWPNVSDKSNVVYQLDYGVGSKVQNVEQFRTAFKGFGESHVISGLMPGTKYRLRICPILLKESTTECDTSSSAHSNGEAYGVWSDTVTVMTKELQTIDPTSVGTYATVSLHGKDTVVDFEKPGKVVAKNEYEYERTSWEIRIPQHLAHRCPLDSNSFIKVGVTNRSGKTYNIVGSVINYGLSSEAFVIKVFLDLNNRTMVVYNSNNKSKEVVNNLPIGPLYPAFQNKTSKDSNFPLKLNIKFDLPYTLNELKDLE